MVGLGSILVTKHAECFFSGSTGRPSPVLETLRFAALILLLQPGKTRAPIIVKIYR